MEIKYLRRTGNRLEAARTIFHEAFTAQTKTTTK